MNFSVRWIFDSGLQRAEGPAPRNGAMPCQIARRISGGGLSARKIRIRGVDLDADAGESMLARHANDLLAPLGAIEICAAEHEHAAFGNRSRVDARGQERLLEI